MVDRRSQYSSLIGPGPECGGYGEDALCVIQTTLADPCPDIKKLAAQLVMTLAARAENRKMLRLRGQKKNFKLHKISLLPCAGDCLAAPLARNISHRQAAVRAVTVAAVGKLGLATQGGFFEDMVTCILLNFDFMYRI